MSARNNKTKGFTLVELLVVLAIIGLLAIIAIPAILNAQKASRNAGRVKVLESIQAASANVFTKTNATVTITGTTSTASDGGSSTGNIVKIESGTTNKITESVDIKDYTLKIINSSDKDGSCNTTSNKSTGKHIVAVHNSDKTVKTLTYCNEDGDASESLVY